MRVWLLVFLALMGVNWAPPQGVGLSRAGWSAPPDETRDHAEDQPGRAVTVVQGDRVAEYLYNEVALFNARRFALSRGNYGRSAADVCPALAPARSATLGHTGAAGRSTALFPMPSVETVAATSENGHAHFRPALIVWADVEWLPSASGTGAQECYPACPSWRVDRCTGRVGGAVGAPRDDDFRNRL
jgi:hypothetical protein